MYPWHHPDSNMFAEIHFKCLERNETQDLSHL